MYPDAYVTYLVHFHGDRDYFECHEVLEEYWKRLPPAARDPVWAGLIQVAVALYHQRRGNLAGAVKMMRSAIAILRQSAARVEELGLDRERLDALLVKRLREMEQNASYESLDLPIRDPALLARCRERCAQQGMEFGRPSDLANSFLVHKHALRDRSGIVKEREQRLREKRDARHRSP